MFREGALITLDGTRGQVMAGAPAMIAPELGGAFSELLDWADAVRDLGVRANADTPAEARMARDFAVDGLGLCRTEHMFFDAARITVMREMILADTDAERQAALDQLLPMQRADFVELFEIMHGLPVTIRLLDPPLHEFLPQGEEDLRGARRGDGPAGGAGLGPGAGARRGQPDARDARRAARRDDAGDLRDAGARDLRGGDRRQPRRAAAPVVPEVMIPLVSAIREVELVKARIDAVAAAVQARAGRGARLPARGDGRDAARGAPGRRPRRVARRSSASAPTT